MKIREVLNVTLEIIISIVNSLGDVIIYHFFQVGAKNIKIFRNSEVDTKMLKTSVEVQKKPLIGVPKS